MGYTGVGRDDVEWSGNVGAKAPKPIKNLDLTRKDYVDTQDQLILTEAKNYTDSEISDLIVEKLAFHDHQDVTTTASPNWQEATIANNINIGNRADGTFRLPSPVNIPDGYFDLSTNGVARMLIQGDTAPALFLIDTGGNANEKVFAFTLAAGILDFATFTDVLGARFMPMRIDMSNGASTLLSVTVDDITIDTITINNNIISTLDGMTIQTGDRFNLKSDDDIFLEVGAGKKVDINRDLEIGGELTAPKIKLTAIGGYAIKLTNKTGSNSVAGQLVKADIDTDDAFVLAGGDDLEHFGVVLDSGVSDGTAAWIVIYGIADVAMEDNTTATRANWVRMSITEAGYADATNADAPQPINQTHFAEVGHCIETVTATGIGTHVLARCMLHFN